MRLICPSQIVAECDPVYPHTEGWLCVETSVRVEANLDHLAGSNLDSPEFSYWYAEGYLTPAKETESLQCNNTGVIDGNPHRGGHWMIEPIGHCNLYALTLVKTRLGKLHRNLPRYSLRMTSLWWPPLEIWPSNSKREKNNVKRLFQRLIIVTYYLYFQLLNA